MRLALAQIASTTDVEANLRLVGQAVGRAAAGGADLVLLPEYAMYEKKAVDASFPVAAQTLDGPFCRALSRTAAEAGVAVVAGMVERHPDGGHPYNTLVAFEKDGSLVGCYRKQHLFDAFGFRESTWISRPEPSAVVLPLAGARVGLMTCSDVRHPVLAADLAAAGAEIIGLCSSWVPGPTKTEQWRVLARARAIENVCFVAAVSQCPPVSIGSSLVVDPLGVVRAELGGDPEVLFADIDTGEVTRTRAAAAS